MRTLFIVAALILAGCASGPRHQSPKDKSDFSRVEMLSEGLQMLTRGGPRKAIGDYFDPVISSCADVYNEGDQKTFCARTPTESFYYLLRAAADKKRAQVVDQTCAEALYLKGYASLDLGRLDDAQEYVERALELSPVNAAYLGELGHILQVKRQWENSLEVFRQAEEYAGTYSPEEVKDYELGRAMRGIGYSLIEMGRLDEAEEKYRERLQINKDDEGAQKELRYIEALRSEDREVEAVQETL